MTSICILYPALHALYPLLVRGQEAGLLACVTLCQQSPYHLFHRPVWPAASQEVNSGSFLYAAFGLGLDRRKSKP